jgi:spermidine/putrescine transport system permease protein
VTVSGRRRVESLLVDVALYGGTLFVLLFLYVPIVGLLVMSVNDGRFSTLPFDGVSLRWYEAVIYDGTVRSAVYQSAWVAVLTTVIACALGNLAALVVIRHRARWVPWLRGVTVAPLLFPQVVLGFVLLVWFSMLGDVFDFGPSRWTVLAGHVAYITPFAFIVIAVQVFYFDESLEEAAMDCGASRWQVYREITMPLVWPGVASAAIFSFLLSWGNFYISYALSGTEQYVPTLVFSAISIGATPAIPALAALILLPSLLLVFIAEAMRQRSMRRSARQGAAGELMLAPDVETEDLTPAGTPG